MSQRKHETIRRALLGTLAIAVGVVAPAAARADVRTTYDVTKCRPAELDEVSELSAKSNNLSNVGPNIVTVHCPVVKTTSGPGLGNDNLVNITIPVTGNQQVECDWDVWRSDIPSQTSSNQLMHVEGVPTNGVIVVGPDEFNIGGFWDGDGDGWYFVDMQCELQPGSGIANYTTDEGGTLQSGRIFPASSCAPDPSTTFAYELAYDSDPPGGYVEALQTGQAIWDCPVPANTEAQIFVAPSLEPQEIGCKLDNHNFSSFTWGPVSGPNPPGQTFPTVSLPLWGQPAMVVPSGTHDLVCGQPTAGDGDGALVSYRTWTSVQIDAGGGAAAPFLSDRDVSGGTTINHANKIDVSQVQNPAPQAVYQSARVGNFTYTVPGFTPGSLHQVRLHFAETYWSSRGARVFDVSVNGVLVLNRFDVYGFSGGKDVAVALPFVEAASSKGTYVIQVTSYVDQGLLSGIEIQN
jgi:hypothetical protein